MVRCRRASRHFRFVIVDHLLQTPNVFHGKPQRFDFRKFFTCPSATAVSVRRKSRRNTGRYMLSECCETIIHLFYTISFPGVPPGHGSGLLCRTTIRHKLYFSFASQIAVRRHQYGGTFRCRRQGPLALDHRLRGGRNSSRNDNTIRLRRRMLYNVVHLVRLTKSHRMKDCCHVLFLSCRSRYRKLLFFL